MPPQRTHTDEGFELTFATNVLGPFLLTNLLLDTLRRGAPLRIVNVSSGGMYTQKLDVDDLQLEQREYDPPAFYAHTKRCEVILTELWAERLRGSGVSVHAMHPGWADTPGVRTSLPRFRKLTRPLLRDSAQGADTIVWLATADEPAERSGLFWHDREPRPLHRSRGPGRTPTIAAGCGTNAHGWPAGPRAGPARGGPAERGRLNAALRRHRAQLPQRRGRLRLPRRLQLRQGVDPTAVSAERLSESVGEGAEFRVVVRFAGRENEFLYRGPPLKVGAAVVDLVCGLNAVIGIQAALAERERTGRGGHVEVSLMDASLLALLNQGSAWVLGGVVPQRRGNRHPSITPYETYDCADRPIAVAVGNDRLFARLCAALGLPDLPADERFDTNSARVANADALSAHLEPILRTQPAAHWVETLRAAAVPAGPINAVDEAFALAAELGMEPVQELAGYPLPAPPLRLDGERPAIRRPPPKLDEHGAELRAWLSAEPPAAAGSSSAA